MAGQSADVQATAKDLFARFDSILGEPRELNYTKYCRIVDSDGAYEKYAQVDRLPFPTQWIDQRSPQGVAVANTYTLANNTYQMTIDIDEDLMMDAKAWEISDFIAQAAMRATEFPDKLLTGIIEAGVNAGSNGINGTTFYQTANSYNGNGVNPFSNKIAGSGVTLLNLQADLAAAFASMLAILDNEGGLVNNSLKQTAGQFRIQCHPTLKYLFQNILNTSWLPLQSGASGENIQKGMADLDVDGYLAGPRNWYLHYVGQPTKPFVFQEREKLKTFYYGPGSYHTETYKKIRIGTKHRFRMNYMYPYRSVVVINP